MRGRNPFVRDTQDLERAAQRVQQEPADQARAMATDAAIPAGTFATDGTWQPYGKTGITTLGEGFRVR